MIGGDDATTTNKTHEDFKLLGCFIEGKIRHQLRSDSNQTSADARNVGPESSLRLVRAKPAQELVPGLAIP